MEAHEVRGELNTQRGFASVGLACLTCLCLVPFLSCQTSFCDGRWLKNCDGNACSISQPFSGLASVGKELVWLAQRVSFFMHKATN